MFIFKKRPIILVVGSAHVDVFGDFDTSQANAIDKEGEIVCSIGGTAFNIAVDLASEATVQVILYTHLKKNSLSTDLIIRRLRREFISTRYVIRDDSIKSDSGFIAHRSNMELTSAVSSMPIQQATINIGKIESIAKRSSVIIAECNLSSAQLNNIAKICTKLNKPFLVGGVSESKCKRVRLLDAAASPLIAYFSINITEAAALIGKPLGKLIEIDASTAKLICELSRASTVIITGGSDGWINASIDGSIKANAAPVSPVVVSTSGAGDALIAGLGYHLAHDRSPSDISKATETIHRFIDRVLRHRASSGSEFTNVDSMNSEYRHYLKLLSRNKSSFIGAALAGIGLIAGIIQAAVSLETSTTVADFIRRIFSPDRW